MSTAAKDLRLERLDVIHAGAGTWPLGDDMRAAGIEEVFSELEPL